MFVFEGEQPKDTGQVGEGGWMDGWILVVR